MPAIATASSTIRLPSGHLFHLQVGRTVPDEIVMLMSDDHRERVLQILDEGELLPRPDDPDSVFADPVGLGWEPGTLDDPRLAGAPGTNQPAAEILAWVDGDLARAEAVFDREMRKSHPRRNLIEPLTVLLDGDESGPT